MFDWITGFVEQSGYLGIALLMFAENLFPPIPSEVIMPLAGFTAAGGDLHIVIFVLAGSVGPLLGAVFCYHFRPRVGTHPLNTLAARHGRWLPVPPADIRHPRPRFAR